MDALLAHPSPGPFLLDGQAITLLDYLTVRPDQSERLGTALRGGQLEAGPWFVLADNLIPSGEAIVRNLQAGRRVLTRLGASAPRVAYCPDTFGHPAALPQIAAGFGLPVAVVWRGAGGGSMPLGDAFEWFGPEGTSVFTYHLPPDGYEFGSALPANTTAAAERWQALATLFTARGRTDIALLLNGADHHARQPDIATAIVALQRAAASVVNAEQTASPPPIGESPPRHAGMLSSQVAIESCTLQSWADRFQDAASRSRKADTLPRVTGELRDSYGYTWTLGGTLATRAHQKRCNARLERDLLRDVEPWLALVVLHDPLATHRAVSVGGCLTMAQLPALLDTAWESLLATHPHDTLCGCSVDAVAQAMDVAQMGVAEQGRGLREAALQLVLGHDVIAARARAPARDGSLRKVPAGDPDSAPDGALGDVSTGIPTHTSPGTLSGTPTVAPVVVRNRAARVRGGLTHLVLRSTVADVPVGPSSATAGGVVGSRASVEAAYQTWAPCTGALMVQLLGVPRCTWERRESPQHYPDNDLVVEQRLLAWMPEVPAHGLRVWYPEETSAPSPPRPISVSGGPAQWQLDNGRVQLTVSRDGHVMIGMGERIVSDALHVESCPDLGDSYTPSPGLPQRFRVSDVRLCEEGPLRGAIELSWLLEEPGESKSDVGTPRGPVRVHTVLRLSVGCDAVECRASITNQRTDHRVRLVWHTDVAHGEVWADAAFGPVRRAPIVPPAGTREAVPDGMPLHRWVLHQAGMRCASLISDGLAETEVRDGVLAVTLLRAVGALSRADIPERPGHAGWPADVPEAQCQGSFTAHLALLLSEGTREEAICQVSRVSDEILLPLVGETWRDLVPNHQQVSHAGPSLHGDGLVASAVTIAQREPYAVVLRAVNWRMHDVTGHWRLPSQGPWMVTPCRLDETPTAAAMPCGEVLSFTAGPAAIVTFLVQRGMADAGPPQASCTPPP